MHFGIANDLIFENDALARAGEILRERFGGKKILVVCGKSLFRSGKGQKMAESLDEYGIAWEKFDEVPQDPTDVSIDAAAVRFRDAGIQLVLAVGGGSVMDFSKSLCVCLTNDRPIDTVENATGVEHTPIPLVAVPTTAGTGSEVTSFAIVTNTDEVRKAVVAGPWMRAALALCDPTLLQSLPRHLTAYTGMDALTHAIEAYTSRLSSPISDLFALEAIRLLGGNLIKAYEEPDVLEHREKTLLGSTLAGYAFDNAVLGMVHAMAHPMGAHFHVQHGAANAIALAECVRFNGAVVPEKTLNIGIALGIDPAQITIDATVARIKDMCAVMNIPSLKEVGITPGDYRMLAEAAMKESCMPLNARECTVEDVLSIYQKLN